MERTSLGLLFILTVSGTTVATISDLRRCGDPACKKPVSEGVTLLAYPSNDENVLSFPNNAPVIIYSKEAGSRLDLWGVEIKGKRGYVPKKLIKELKVLVPKLEYEVPTEAFAAKDVESLRPDLSKEELFRNQGETVKKTSSSENPIPEQIAVTAEDVEYNNLNVPGTVEEGHPEVEEKEAAQVNSEPLRESEWAEDPVNDNADTSSENVKATEEEEDKHGEEEENEEEEEQEEEISSDDIFIEQKKDDTEKETLLESTNISDILQDTESTTEEATVFSSTVPESDTQSESVEQTVPHETHNEQNSPQLESSSAGFEVIDGTTIYFNEDLATPTVTLPDVQATAMPQASTVQAENFATVDASSIHPQSSVEILQDDGSGKSVEPLDIRNSERLNPLSSTPVLDDNVQPSVVASATASPPDALPRIDDQLESNTPTAPNLRNLVLPPDNLFEKDETGGSHEVLDNQGSNEEAMSDVADDESSVSTGTAIEGTAKATADSQIDTNPESSTETASESTTEPSVDTNSQSTTDLPEEEFGVPKPETILEGAGAEVEKPVENVGFFASWFGSSEGSESKDESEVGTDEEEEEEENEGEGETDRANADVEFTSASEDSRTNGAEAGATDTSANNVSTDFVDNPVDVNDIPPNYTQATYSAEDVDTRAYNSQQPTPPSVDNKPPESATPGNSEGDFQSPPSPAADLIPDPDPGTGREEETPFTGGRETEPGPSTARPLYAEPLPTTPSYPTHANVDPGDMDRLADVAGESTTQNKDDEDKISTAEGSLAEKFLKTSHNLLESVAAVLQLPEGLAFGVEAELAEPEMSSGVLVFLGVVVATIITIYFVHLCMVKLSRESPMLEALNRIDRENRIITAENTSLHEQLIRSRSELERVSSRVNESSGDISELDTQLEMIKDEHASEKAQLEEKIVQLEHELEEATTNGMEMHKMLSEMLSSQKDTSTFQASVDHLQSMLDGQREKVETLNSDLALKTRLNEELHSELSAAKERVTNLDSQVQQLTHSLKELSSGKEDLNVRLENESKLVKDLQEVNNSLSAQNMDCDSQIGSLSNELKALQDTITQLRDSVETKDSELMVTKECLKQLRLTSDDDHATPDDEKLSSLFDVIRVKAELQRVQTERSRLKEQLQDAETAQRNLEDAMSSIRSEVTQLRSHHDQAVQDKQEALSRLAVLTKYFEEKEAQLTKELESQEGLRVDAEGAAAAGASKLQNYGLELATYKAQVESLRKELQDQETSYKAQLASYEQKVHENWLQARAAERRHEEQRQENSQLRTRLTVLQKERDEAHHLPSTKPHPKRVDANGSVSSPGPEGEGEGNHRDVDSPPVVPHPLAPPPMLPMMFPPGGPLPPVPPPHSLPPGVPPPPHPGLPHGVPPHGLPPPPFLSGEAPFMGPPLPPLPGDRRLPPAGGMSSPPFRRSGSPSYDHRNDRYSPASEHSHFSDHQYSPPPLRHRPGSPDIHRRNHSPDRRSDRTRSPDRRSDRMRSPDRRSNRHTPDRRLDRRSPERHYSTRSPDGYSRHRSSPHRYYDHSDFNSDETRIHSSHMKGKKTSTPLSSTDRWKTES